MSCARHAGCIAALKAVLGTRVSTARAVLEHHSKGEGYVVPAFPDAVATVHSTEEASEVMKICSKFRTPVVPFGAGSSLEGHVQCVQGGVAVDFNEMNTVLEINEADMDCKVQAGVNRVQLNKALRGTGLFFPVDPGAEASLGGMAATRASGTTTVRYGSMRDNVLGLTCVAADGRVFKTGGRARKSAAGYDLTRLLIGSEGTLALVTELRLRLFGLPPSVGAARLR
eukprot:RCo006066